MKNIILMFVIFCVGLLSASCIHDDPDVNDPSCDRYIDVRALGGDNSQIKDVVVYVYDSTGKLLGVHYTEAATPMNIESYRSYGTIKVVVWGNTQGASAGQSLSEPVIGSSISDHMLTQNLTTDSFLDTPLTHLPSDVFYTSMDLNFADMRPVASSSVSATVYVERVVSSYVLTVNGLGQAFNEPGGGYKVLIRHPYSGLDFAGNPVGGESIYMVPTTYDATRDKLTSPIGVALPTGSQNLIIEIYSVDNKLLYTTTVDSFGNPISLVAGKLHNIHVDLNRTVVEIVVSEWGQIVIFEGFN